ncbi:MAG: antibiotic biosynthesis monooxygenase [Caulobacteraceae bacterium]
MTKPALLVQLKAKPGKEGELASFLTSARPLAEAETGTLAWFAIRFTPDTFAIFDAFADDQGLEAHLDGPIAAALSGRADELLAEPPKILRAEVLADTLPT